MQSTIAHHMKFTLSCISLHDVDESTDQGRTSTKSSIGYSVRTLDETATTE